MTHPFSTPAVARAFDAFPEPAATMLRQVRDEIFATARGLPSVGTVTETLKWGQPSYATSPRTGTPIRLGMAGDGHAAILTHCQTRVIADARDLLPEHRFDGNRAMLLDPTKPLPRDALRIVLARALTYHQK